MLCALDTSKIEVTNYNYNLKVLGCTYRTPSHTQWRSLTSQSSRLLLEYLFRNTVNDKTTLKTFILPLCLATKSIHNTYLDKLHNMLAAFLYICIMFQLWIQKIFINTWKLNSTTKVDLGSTILKPRNSNDTHAIHLLEFDQSYGSSLWFYLKWPSNDALCIKITTL